jgi:hypothetical protein
LVVRPPQPSETCPQVPLGKSAQVFFTHAGGPPQTLATPPPPQVCPVGQVPQLVVRPPQPSGIGPQVPAGNAVQFLGVHAGGAPPQTLATPPPPQMLPPVQVPQLAVSAPQPSET